MAISCKKIIMLTLTVDTVFVCALPPLSVNMVLFTVTAAIYPVIVIVYTNGSVYTNGCYRALYYGRALISMYKLMVLKKCDSR